MSYLTRFHLWNLFFLLVGLIIPIVYFGLSNVLIFYGIFHCITWPLRTIQAHKFISYAQGAHS